MNKYDYQPISRKQIEGKRKYMTPDGNAVASVTTILDATSDKSGLIAWRKRVGETKAREITTEAAGVGTAMYLEEYAKDNFLSKFPFHLLPDHQGLIFFHHQLQQLYLRHWWASYQELSE